MPILHDHRNSLLRALCLTLCALFFTRSAIPQAPIISQHDGKILLGAAWYPEQWPEQRWDADLTLMEKAGIHVVRVGEFAWSAMEPAEGRFDFAWLDRAVALAAKHHIFVVLGTPTAAPPAWLTQRYPDVLRVDENGRRAQHGNRQHFSFDSPRYRDFCRRIAQEMARRFGHNPNVIGWQIDNEYANPSFDDYTRGRFQQWLKAKYVTLDNLNTHWTTAYWSQTYFDWSQIPIPVGGHNPGLKLDWNRFISDTWRSYQANQLHAIRTAAGPRQFITTNTMGFFDGFDHYTVSADLTFSAWDNYVGQGHTDPAYTGMTHDLTRGFLRRNFWVMETQPGAVNWAGINNFLNKGEVRALAWESVGHGADAVSYWQWRSALNGQEQYHGTLVGADGTPVPLYAEVSQVGREFAAASAALRGTSPISQVAMLNDYDSRWAIEWQKHHHEYDQLHIFADYYRSIRKLTQQMDVVAPTAPLDSYKLVVAPDLNLIPASLAKHLMEYVRNGGHLVLGPRSGMKDEFNALLPQRQPGFLAQPLGARVEQFYALDEKVPLNGVWGTGEATWWAEQLGAVSSDSTVSTDAKDSSDAKGLAGASADATSSEAGGTSETGRKAETGRETETGGPQVLLRYGASNGWLDDQPAAVTRTYGKGSITYIGAVLDEALMQSAAKWMVEGAHITAAFGPVPDGVEVCERTVQSGGESRAAGEGANSQRNPNSNASASGKPRNPQGNANRAQKKVFILINWKRTPQHINLPRPMVSVLASDPDANADPKADAKPTGESVQSLDLAAYGVAVLEE